jgi:hypothetical protein
VRAQLAIFRPVPFNTHSESVVGNRFLGKQAPLLSRNLIRTSQAKTTAMLQLSSSTLPRAVQVVER